MYAKWWVEYKLVNFSKFSTLNGVWQEVIQHLYDSKYIEIQTWVYYYLGILIFFTNLYQTLKRNRRKRRIIIENMFIINIIYTD